jgi:hypothetical protein
MMQRLLTKYGLAFHVACICLLPLCFFAQSRAFGCLPLFWLSLIAIEWLILLPSIRRDETLADARQRVLRAFWRDPFLYAGLAVIGLVGGQCLNSGCELVYLPDADVWKLSAPPIPWAVFSVESGASVLQLAVFTACLAVGVILRTAVGKAARRFLLQSLSGISGIVALVCIELVRRGDERWGALASGAEASAVGIYFGFWLLVGMGLFAEALAGRRRERIWLFLTCFLGNLLGLIWFASPLAILACVIMVVLLFIYWLIYLAPLVTKSTQVLLFLSTMGCVSVIVVGLILFAPNPVSEKLEKALPLTEYCHEMSLRNGVRAKAAISVWREYPWVGVGANGFYHTVGLVVDAGDWKVFEKDRAHVYNDGIQFLCEYGMIGVGFLVVSLIALLGPICYRARLVWKKQVSGMELDRLFLFRLPPVVVTGALALLLCCLESANASPFRSAAVLLSWVCVLSSMPAFLPEKPREELREG